jgi:hypothetical protein
MFFLDMAAHAFIELFDFFREISVLLIDGATSAVLVLAGLIGKANCADPAAFFSVCRRAIPWSLQNYGSF